ncbi:hypothetical protein [Xanthobacter sp.]|uniref:hypothetical protein n=1 Tax=Xanthobacter sp. TaxID=35809 RepID=UPI0025E5642F|nr:hypothetical protein [Xanthobacter sp.]
MGERALGAKAVGDKAGGKMKRMRAAVGGAFGRIAAAAAVAALAFAPASFAPAKAANLAELNFWLSGPNYSGVIPACDSQEALDLIATRFAETERRFWASALSITDFEKVHEIAYRPWGPEYQPRRYCRGTVFTNDLKKRAIYYSIIEDGGFIGASWGVEWCVVGLDRNYAYAPSCKMAGP